MCIARGNAPGGEATRLFGQVESTRERGLAVRGGYLALLPPLGLAWVRVRVRIRVRVRVRVRARIRGRGRGRG